MLPIVDVARALDLAPDELETYGPYKAKIPPQATAGLPERGRLVLVSAITPTPAGEGKTTTSIGLVQALVRQGVRAVAALREPSLGPVFGQKGGGAGGGASQLEPALDIDLHFTGDFHAVTSAHNLLAALVDNHLHHGNALGLDPRRIGWRRVLDINDRALRHIVLGLGGEVDGVPREAGFDITAASEVMAVLCLATGVADLKARLGRIVVGHRPDGHAVTAQDLGAVGAMAVLLRDALKPNLVQTSEGAPALVHGGPFANIAHGTNSILATRAALRLADVVVTEAGFAADLGAEKFFDIACGYGGFAPSATVLVATVRALKMHGGAALTDVDRPDLAALARGLPNLDKQLDNIQQFGQACVVAINGFPSDTEPEVAALQAHCAQRGIEAVPAQPFSQGGAGCDALASAVRRLLARHAPGYRPLYDWQASIEDKIATVARTMYGASAVAYSAQAQRQRLALEAAGHGRLPVCIAKTPLSLSDNPALKGRPRDFVLTVREIQLAAGAGFLIPITGDLMRMPGLPKVPRALRFDLADDGTPVLGPPAGG